MMRIWAILLPFLAISNAYPASDSPSVTVSIAPVHSLFQGVAQGGVEAKLLFDSTISPHNHALSPSLARAIERSDQVVWMGPNFELAMARLMSEIPSERQLQLVGPGNGLHFLENRHGGLWGEGHHHDEDDHDQEHHDEEHHDEGHHDEEHHDGGEDRETIQSTLDIDPHFWLSFSNARSLVELFEHLLKSLDPQNEALYHNNAAEMLNRIELLEGRVRERISGLDSSSFLVMHDAYQYFEKEMGLKGAGAVTLDPQRTPGARRIIELRQQIREGKVVCVFAEKQVRAAVIKTLAEDTDVRIGELDPIGAELNTGVDLWFEVMNNLANSFSACLSG